MVDKTKIKHPSPAQVERQKRKEVLEMLPQDGSPIRWSALEKKTRQKRMSLRTLRKNLDKLEKVGVVIRDVDPSFRPPGVFYRINLSSFPVNTRSRVTIQVKEALTLDKISQMLSNKSAIVSQTPIVDETVRKALEATLKTYTWDLAQTAALIIQFSLLRTQAYANTESVESGDSQYLLTKNVHDYADELLDLEFRPLIHKLLDFALINWTVSREIVFRTQIEMKRRTGKEEGILERVLEKLAS